MTVYEKKNVICIDVVQNSSGAGQNIRNIYKIYNKNMLLHLGQQILMLIVSRS